MTLSVKHTFTSGIAEGSDATKVRTNNWNAEHTITMATGTVMGRGTAGSGAVEELVGGLGLELTANSITAIGAGLYLWSNFT